MTPRVRVVAAVLALAALLFGSVFWWVRRERGYATLDYATRITGLPLRAAELVEMEDDAEVSLHLYAMVPVDERGAFSVFPVVAPPEVWPPRQMGRARQMRAWPAPSSTRLRGIHGCTDGNTWLGYLDESSGELWLEVNYPDWGGDPPGCRPPPW